ncbi:MAG: SBBP repeat-containing protein [bacterium]|nr:SBBP repeat-containing protein [bacterium]
MDTSYNGDWDVFVSKLNPSGTGLLYSTYLGGSGRDFGRGIAVDAAGNAYITGDTYSSNFPTIAGAFDTTHNGNADAFVSKLTLRPTLVEPSFWMFYDIQENSAIQ